MKNKFTPLQPGRVFTFALNGKATLPSFAKPVPLTLPESTLKINEAAIAPGETLFWKYCGTCHVVAGGGGGLAPDLAYSAIAANSETLLNVVRNGALLSKGMPAFGNRLSEAEVSQIQTYVLAKARELRQSKQH
jgi:quinohemoprotein ethanol dehydrogenase